MGKAKSVQCDFLGFPSKKKVFFFSPTACRVGKFISRSPGRFGQAEGAGGAGPRPSEIRPARKPLSVVALGGSLMSAARFLGSKLFPRSAASGAGIPNIPIMSPLGPWETTPDYTSAGGFLESSLFPFIFPGDIQENEFIHLAHLEAGLTVCRSPCTAAVGSEMEWPTRTEVIEHVVP